MPPPPPLIVATCHHRPAVMWLIVAFLIVDEIASKEEIANIHDELFFCAWFVTCVFSCVEFLPLDREILNGQPSKLIWAERSLRDDLENVKRTEERVEVIEIEHDVRKTPSSMYFGDYITLGTKPRQIRYKKFSEQRKDREVGLSSQNNHLSSASLFVIHHGASPW